ncbi:MAG: hypothetical protein LIO62_05445 [Clostridiales bacterium]|nr:hypothetical protein [Clostridiales bacterium]
MIVFLIILAVLVVLIIALLCISASVTLVYDKGWHTQLQILFIKKDIVLSEILSFILFPDRKAKEVSKQKKDKKKQQNEKKNTDKAEKIIKSDVAADDKDAVEDKDNLTNIPKSVPKEDSKTDNTDKDKTVQKAPEKSNPIKKMWDEEGIVGILSFASNLLETANSAILTLIRGLHIYSLYVMIIVGGYDAEVIGRSYGRLCQYYYPVKGLILNQMKVDQYDDYIQPDFIAESNEYEFQMIASISVGLLLKVVLKAGFVFLKNLISNKKQNNNSK